MDMDMDIEKFLEELSSAAPTPGGGGVAALLASLSSALCSMVANLTRGKKKYAEYAEDIEKILEECGLLTPMLYSYIEKDAESFEPLSKAYGIPKDDPDREEILEKALVEAARTPLELMKEMEKVCELLKHLETKGSRLAISDVAVSAITLSAASKSAIMNVYINTGLMKDRQKASDLNNEANEILKRTVSICDKIYDNISLNLMN